MYEMNARIRYSELDATGRLSTMGLMNFLQDAAIFHCEDIGRSVASLAEDGFAWYVLTWDIKIYSLPQLSDRIHVRTWIPAMRGLVCNRFAQIVDDEGNVLVDATSTWVFFDVERGRAIRIPDKEAAYFAGEFEGTAVRKSRRSFKPQTEGVTVEPITVGVQHIDTNFHVNNAQYIRIAREVVAEAARAGLVPAELAKATRALPLNLAVEYRNMARLGDVLTPTIYQEGDGVVVSLDLPDKVSSVVRFERI